MTDKSTGERKKLLRLADALFDDLMATSDKEILAEFADDGGDADLLADQMRDRVDSTVLQAGKKRMQAAQSGVRAIALGFEALQTPDVANMRRAVRSAFEREGLSMAARNETESDLTDDEVFQKYNDLVELGVINPVGDEGSDP